MGKAQPGVQERHTCACRPLIYPQISANLITAGLNVSRLMIFTCLSLALQDVWVLNKISGHSCTVFLVVARC